MKHLEALRGIAADATSLGQSMTFHRQMVFLASLMAVAILVLCFPVRYYAAVIRLLLLPIAIGVVAAVVLPGLWVCWEWKRKWFPVLLEFVITVAWVATIWALSYQLALIAARSPFPLADSILARLDAHLIQTVSIVRWIHNYHHLRIAFVGAYVSLDPLVVLAFVAPILYGRFDQSRRLLLAITLSLFLTIGMFALLPAIGPWTVEGFHPSTTQAPIGPYLKALKSGITPLGPELSGIVAFPSFHTVLALLAATALWKIRKLRWFATAVALGVCIGTVTTGWHYIVDVLAGCVVAAVSWFAAGVLMSVDRKQTNCDFATTGWAEFDAERV